MRPPLSSAHAKFPSAWPLFFLFIRKADCGRFVIRFSGFHAEKGKSDGICLNQAVCPVLTSIPLPESTSPVYL